MVCYYFTSDLMFTSKVKPFAQENGWTLRFPAFEAIDFSSIPDLILIDLDDVTSPDLDDLMRKFREKWKDLPATVAYGPPRERGSASTRQGRRRGNGSDSRAVSQAIFPVVSGQNDPLTG